MRLVLTKESREDLFLLLKDKYNVRTFKGLANKMQIPNKTLQTWRLGERSIPSEIIPICVNSLTVLERKPDNWGMIKGGANRRKKKCRKYEKKIRKGRVSKDEGEYWEKSHACLKRKIWFEFSKESNPRKNK